MSASTIPPRLLPSFENCPTPLVFPYQKSENQPPSALRGVAMRNFVVGEIFFTLISEKYNNWMEKKIPV